MSQQAPSAPQPTGFKPLNSPWGVQTTAVAIVVWVLAALFVSARFIARAHPVRPGLDDWIVLASLVPALGVCACAIVWSVKGGLGWHSSELSPEQTKTSLQTFYAAQCLYALTITPIKISILLLYKRIFEAPAFRKVTWICVGFVNAWFLSTLFAVIFQCTPVYGAWEPGKAERCIDARAFFLGNGIASMLMDVFILCLPMPMVWRMKLSTNRKLALTGMFLLGSFVCVTSVVRITTLVGSNRADPSYTQSQSEMWSCVETCIGIVCSCLPTLGPLVKRIATRLNSRLSSDQTDHQCGTHDLPLNSFREGRTSTRYKSKKGVELDTINLVPPATEVDINSGDSEGNTSSYV